jgi:hypothetical protein
VRRLGKGLDANGRDTLVPQMAVTQTFGSNFVFRLIVLSPTAAVSFRCIAVGGHAARGCDPNRPVMKDAKGQVLWQGSDLMSALNSDNKVGHPLEDLLKDPQALRQAFTTGSDLVSGMLMRNLAGLEATQNTPGIQK